MVDQRPRSFRGNRDLNIRHRDSEIQQNHEDAVNERTALASRALYIQNAKMGNPRLPRTVHFSCWWSIPQSPLNIGRLQWLRVSAKRSFQERVEVGSSFSISASFSMPRMRSTFAFMCSWDENNSASCVDCEKARPRFFATLLLDRIKS